jgi:GrpB-like predicted nucleotidyltransferase (UPF0157 family)
MGASLVLGWLWVRTESLWIVAIAHGALNNWGQLAFKYIRAFDSEATVLAAGNGALLLLGLSMVGFGLRRTRLNEPIHLSPYDPFWPAMFAAEARRIATGLPVQAAIEHIGSTAVPGLLAKPIVDLMIGVPEQDVEVVRPAIAALGYEDLGEAGVPGRIYLRRREPAAFNIALVVRDGSVWRANLALRDFLRRDAAAASEYAEIKRAALESGAHSLLAYSDYKSAVVSSLVARAQQ